MAPRTAAMRDSCDLWTGPEAVLADRDGRFERIATYESGSHREQALLRCACCGRLYLHEYRDDIDWEGGDDPSWETFVPVQDEAEAVRLLRDPAGLMRTEPRLHHDRPTGGRARTAWTGRPRAGAQRVEGS